MSYPPTQVDPPATPAPQPAQRRKSPAALIFAVVAVLLLIVTVIAIAATGGGKSDQPAAAPTASSSSGDAGMASAVAAAGIPPKPDAATAAAYIADLQKIDPDIVGTKEADIIVDRGRNACAWAKNHPDDPGAAVEGVRKRFTSPSHPAGFTGDVPARIWAVVHARLCPTY